MLDFLRNVFERRKQPKKEREFTEISSAPVKSVDELDRVSAALKKRDDDLIAASSALKKSDDELAVRVLQYGVMAELRQRETETVSSQLASVIESSDNAIISTSPQGIIMSWNPSAGRIFGFSEQEAVGNSISIIVPEEKIEEHNKTLELLQKGETVGHFETARVRKSGDKIDVSMTASPIKNAAGEVVGISMIARDVTKEKQDADKLRKSETQLKAAQRIAQMGSWEWDLSANTLNWSQELYHIYGISPGETINFDRFLELVHPEDRRLVQSFVESKRMFSIEHRIVRPDGDIRFIQARGEVISDSEGKPISLMGIAQDITDRKRADEQLRTSREQLRALSAHLQFIREEERSRIAREVHDELGQVLTALKMDISLLNQKLLESSAVLPRRMLYEEIRSMSKKVDATIKSVRKIVTELRPEVLDHLGLKAAIEWQAQEFQSHSGIDCKLDPHMEAIEMNNRDGETAIFRILQEALTNIARHSGASKVEIFLNRKDGEITMEVRDNGRGITDADMSKSRSFGLLGMRERAIFLGGDLEVTGTPGFGTSVKIQIPVKKSQS